MYYQQHVRGCYYDSVGMYGLTAANLEKYVSAAHGYAHEIQQTIKQGHLPALAIAETTHDLDVLKQVSDYFTQKFEHILILGTGGSSLGAQALTGLKGYGLSFMAKKQKVHFIDNIDPLTFQWLQQELDLLTTGVVVISKSGTTSETVCQCLTLIDIYQEKLKKADLRKHFLIVTEEKKSPLRELARDYGFEFFVHDPSIGGRFSVLSNVGLLPAMMAGVDVAKVRVGAQSVLNDLAAEACAPVHGAAIAVALNEIHHMNVNIIMPYVDRLAYFGLWFRQLWAESLGKDGKGLTPVRAMGTVDQHSQLQLYLDGPRDKYFTVITSDCVGVGRKLSMHNVDGTDYLSGHCMGDLMDAEQRATIAMLIRHQCPTRILHIPEIGELSLGALLMHYMIETIIAAKLMGIDAFDQPAVEEGKILTREYLKEIAA